MQPYLDALSEKIGQSSSVSILDETEIVYIARAAQRRVMSISLMPGSRLPAYCTSMGRVLLAALTEDEARSTLEKSALVARTEHTETDIERLLADIKETRERGYAAIDQEVELGLVSVAVPLKAAGGRVVAAANIGMAASGRSMKEVIDHYLPPLLELQADLRQTLV